jgi:hypothetical protein
MKYIAVFEDRKGFTKVLEFAQLPHKYDFVEYAPVGAMFAWNPEVTPNIPQDVKITFLPKGKPEEIYGQIIQKYIQD